MQSCDAMPLLWTTIPTDGQGPTHHDPQPLRPTTFATRVTPAAPPVPVMLCVCVARDPQSLDFATRDPCRHSQKIWLLVVKVEGLWQFKLVKVSPHPRVFKMVKVPDPLEKLPRDYGTTTVQYLPSFDLRPGAAC